MQKQVRLPLRLPQLPKRLLEQILRRRRAVSAATDCAAMTPARRQAHSGRPGVDVTPLLQPGIPLLPLLTMGVKSRSSHASYPLRSSSTAKFKSSWRRGNAMGPGGSGSSCDSNSSALDGPAASKRAGNKGVNSAAAAAGGRNRDGAAAADRSDRRSRLERPVKCCSFACCEGCMSVEATPVLCISDRATCEQ